MTTFALGWFAAGIFFAAFIFLWFCISYQELSLKRSSLNAISEQVAMHRKLFMQERGGQFDSSAQNMLSSKLIAYEEAKKIYNGYIKKPLYFIPAYIMGFRNIGNEATP